MPPSTERNITATQAAARFGLHPSQIRRLCASLGVGLKIGRDWLLNESDLGSIARRPPARRSYRKSKS